MMALWIPMATMMASVDDNIVNIGQWGTPLTFNDGSIENDCQCYPKDGDFIIRVILSWLVEMVAPQLRIYEEKCKEIPSYLGFPHFNWNHSRYLIRWRSTSHHLVPSKDNIINFAEILCNLSTAYHDHNIYQLQSWWDLNWKLELI